MPRRFRLLVAVPLLVLCGCASTDQMGDDGQLTAPRLTFAQVKAAPDTYRGQPVTLGGQVLSARRLKDATRIEILQLPLTSSLQPAAELSRSEGRFVAMQREFLDPATLPPGTLVTVTGELSCTVTLPLDETEYSYPVVQVTNLRVWQPREDELMRVRPSMGPAYWGPYWGPSWRRPFYW